MLLKDNGVVVMETVREERMSTDDIQPYKIHVSSRYLSLTTQKLDLTRLPREINLPEIRSWNLGTPKSALEPVLDYWTSGYKWRDRERELNRALPQFRAKVTPVSPSTFPQPEPLRLHFVHKRSTALDAIPLLYCHSWPGSACEIEKIIGPLTSPIPTHLHPPEDSPSFHVVAPSVPGSGFSDVPARERFGIQDTASYFDGLMERLGYFKYVVHGSGWGFAIARSLAVQFPEKVMAIHTSSLPQIPPQPEPPAKPSILKSSLTSLLSLFSPTAEPIRSSVDLEDYSSSSTPRNTTSLPQTIAFALCDSPSGLLSSILAYLHSHCALHLWTSTMILDLVMLTWLPGPEGMMRWENWAKQEDVWAGWSGIPCGISSYGDEAKMKMLDGRQPVVWKRQRCGRCGIPAVEEGGDVVLDLRAFLAQGKREGWLYLSVEEERESKETVIHHLGSEADLEAQLECDVGNQSCKKPWVWKWPFWE